MYYFFHNTCLFGTLASWTIVVIHIKKTNQSNKSNLIKENQWQVFLNKATKDLFTECCCETVVVNYVGCCEQ